MIVGIFRNPYATNVPNSLLAVAQSMNLPTRVVDAETIALNVDDAGEASVTDRAGIVDADVIAPYLLYGHPAAVPALRWLGRSCYMQNPVDGVLVADDKASTAERLAEAGVSQVPTRVCALNLEQALEAAGDMGYPVVLKRAHGAQGRWVRRAADAGVLARRFGELELEGPGALVVQPEVVECEGRSVRVIITGGEVLAATERFADAGEWRSNVAAGARQVAADLTDEEIGLVMTAAEAVGLRHAGVDVLRTSRGPRVLEVNGCPDYTSMQPYFETDLSAAVMRASARPGQP